MILVDLVNKNLFRLININICSYHDEKMWKKNFLKLIHSEPKKEKKYWHVFRENSVLSRILLGEHPKPTFIFILNLDKGGVCVTYFLPLQLSLTLQGHILTIQVISNLYLNSPNITENRHQKKNITFLNIIKKKGGGWMITKQ